MPFTGSWRSRPAGGRLRTFGAAAGFDWPSGACGLLSSDLWFPPGLLSGPANRGADRLPVIKSGLMNKALAVPVNIWRTIRFWPPLSPTHQAATQEGIAVRNATKLILHGRSPQGGFYAQGREGGSPISLVIPGQSTPDGRIYTAFSADPKFNPTDRRQVERAVRALGAEMTVFDVAACRWGQDEFSQGGWAFRKPGQLTRLYPQVQEPRNRIAIASGDIADGWSGYIDGAIESGKRAARQVADM